MARKNRKRSASKAKQAALSDEAQEELLALAAIFDEHFTADEDGKGFQLAVNPQSWRGCSEPCVSDTAVQVGTCIPRDLQTCAAAYRKQLASIPGAC